MKKDVKYVRYDVALTDNEILLYSQIVNQFKHNEIDFLNLKNIFLSYGIVLDVILCDFSKRKMTISDGEIFEKRISEQKYLYSDINYFVLNSDKFKNVLFTLDSKAIEILANYGISEYQETMISILKTQLRYSFDKDEKLEVERSKWRRRIVELESELVKNDNNNRKK